MITAEQLKQANETMKTINIKGKEYALVAERLRAFRQLCPGGSVTTEMVHFGGGEVVMKATVADEDGKVLGTGYAHELQSSSFINKGSYVENCESSAWGRALSAAGFSGDQNVCSAEELGNAILNQNQEELATSAEKKTFMALCKKYDQDPDQILTKVECKNHTKMTKEDYAKALIILKDIAESVNNGK